MRQKTHDTRETQWSITSSIAIGRDANAFGDIERLNQEAVDITLDYKVAAGKQQPIRPGGLLLTPCSHLS